VRPGKLVGRAITGACGERWFPDRIETGPGTEPEGSTTTYADTGLVYWHLNWIWVEIESAGWVLFDGTALGSRPPEPGVFFGEGEGNQWRVSSIDAPAPLATLLGATITAVTPLYDSFYLRRRWRRSLRPGKYLQCGHIFETTKGGVAIAHVDPTLGSYAVGEWPGDKRRWAALDVVTDVDPRHIPRRT
jgi:hypothetical protein